MLDYISIINVKKKIFLPLHRTRRNSGGPLPKPSAPPSSSGALQPPLSIFIWQNNKSAGDLNQTVKDSRGLSLFINIYIYIIFFFLSLSLYRHLREFNNIMYIYDIPHYYPNFNVLTILKSQGSVNFPACWWHLVLTYHTTIQGLQRSAGPRYEMLWAEIDAVRNRLFSSKILRLLHKYKKHNEVPKHSETTPNQTQLSERICPNHQIAPY